MAAVGCMRDNGLMEGEESSEKEGDLIKLCRKNGIHKDCFMAENARDSLDSKFARAERSQRVNGTSKSVSAIFTKPSIPTLRARKDKTSLEQSKRRRRLSKGESADQRPRCCSQDGSRLLGPAAAAGDSGERTPCCCKLALACSDGKMGLRCGLGGSGGGGGGSSGGIAGGSCSMAAGCSCSKKTTTTALAPSNATITGTQEVCGSLSPPHLVPEVDSPLGPSMPEDGEDEDEEGEGGARGEDQFKRERRDSNGTVEGRGIPDTPISPLPCSPLPFPKIPSSPQGISPPPPPTPPPSLLLPPPPPPPLPLVVLNPGGGGGGVNDIHSNSSSNINYNNNNVNIRVSNNDDHSVNNNGGGGRSSPSSSSSSPLSSIPSPSGSLGSLFGGSQGTSRSQQQQQLAHSLNKGSTSITSSSSNNNSSGNTANTNNNTNITTSAAKTSMMNRSASCSSLAFRFAPPPSPSGSYPFSSSSNNRSSNSSNADSPSPFLASPSQTSSSAPGSTAATPAEEVDVQCQWEECGVVVNPADLLEHLRVRHVDTQTDGEWFVCRWAGCKVAGKASCSMSWLERHVVAHGGHKPFTCILPHCGARFPSQTALHKHVNAHFNALEGTHSGTTGSGVTGNVGSSGSGSVVGSGGGGRSAGRGGRSGEESSARIVRKKNKLKRRRPQCVRNGDFFDSGIMDQLRQQLWDLSEKTRVDLSGSTHITFHGAEKARRTDEHGKESVLLCWTPEDVLEEVWMPSSQVDSNRQRILPLFQLPAPTVTNTHPSLYRRHRFRKHRRK